MKIQEINQAARLHARKFLDKNDTIEAAFIAGAHWANDQNVAKIEELICVLRMLFEEQNDAPNERRREQWQLAMNECRITLKKFDP